MAVSLAELNAGHAEPSPEVVVQRRGISLAELNAQVPSPAASEPPPPSVLERLREPVSDWLAAVGRPMVEHYALPAETSVEAFNQAKDILARRGRDFESGVQRSAAGMDWLAANAAMLVREFFEAGPQAFPRPQIRDAAEWFERNYRRRSEELMQLAEENASEDLTGKVVQTLGGLPLSLLQAGSAASIGGPVAGFAALGALGAADRDAAAVMKEALKGLFLGAVMKTTAGAPRLGRAASVGGTAGVLSEGEDVDRGIEMATMATLAALPGTRPRARRELERPELPDQVRREAPKEEPPWEDLVPVPEPVTAEAVPEPLPPLEPEAFSRRGTAEAVAPGENWAGAVEGVYNPMAVQLGKGTQPIRRDVILAQFVKDMGQPVYQGRMGKRARDIKGFLKRKTRELRIRNRNDFETVAHEMAHEVDLRFPEISKAYKKNVVIEDELKSVSYNRDNAQEGWAEFVRMWMTQPERAHQAAPRTEAFLETLLRKNPQLETAFMRARKGMGEWLAQDALTRARSKVGPEVALDDMFDSTWARWRQGAIDDTYGLERFERAMNEGQLRYGAESATKTAREMRAKYDVANGAVKYGFPEMGEGGSVRYKGSGLIGILNQAQSKGGTLRDFVDYMIGRRAQQLKTRGKERLFSDDEIKAMMSLETPAFKAASEKYQEWNQGVVKFAVDNGVISQAHADSMAQYFYVPFFREGRGRAGGGRGPVSGDVRAVRAIRGGTAALRDPIETMSESTARLIDLAITNQARQKVVELASEPGGGRFLAKIGRDDARVRILTKDAKEAFRERFIEAEYRRKAEELKKQDPGAEQFEIEAEAAKWIAREDIDSAVDGMWEGLGPTITVWQRGLSPKGDNLIAVLKDGKAEYYEVLDPLLLRSVFAFNRPGSTNPIMRLMMGAKGLMQYTVTRTPSFMTANIARDQIQGGVMGRRGYKPFLDGIRGFHVRLADIDSYYNRIMKSGSGRMRARVQEDRQIYRDFVANGGGMGGLYSPELVRSLTSSGMRMRGLRPEGLRQVVIDSPRRLKHAIDEASMAFELATRLGSFRRDIKAGVSPKEAAYEARDLTDFARRGDWEALRFFLDTAPFLNAGIQGLDRFISGVYRDPGSRARVWRGLALVALVSAVNEASNYGNPLYETQSDASKDFYWHFFPPSLDYVRRMANGELKKTSSELVKIINTGTQKEAADALDELQSRYVHYLFPKVWEIGSIATMAERTVEGTLRGMPLEAAKHSARALLANMHFNPIPIAVQPLMESVAGKDFFTWHDITPARLKDIDPAYRYTPRTPLTLRKIGEKTGMSPVEMEHYLQAFFNTWASGALEMTDWGLFDVPPDTSISENPFLRRFTRGKSTGIKPKQDLYQVHRDLGQVMATLEFLKKENRIEDARAYLAAHPEARFYDFTQRTADVLRKTGTALTMVQNSYSLEEVQDIGERWVSAVRGEEHLRMLKASQTWKDTYKLKKWLVDEMRKSQNLAAQRAVRILKEQGVEP